MSNSNALKSSGRDRELLVLGRAGEPGGEQEVVLQGVNLTKPFIPRQRRGKISSCGASFRCFPLGFLALVKIKIKLGWFTKDEHSSLFWLGPESLFEWSISQVLSSRLPCSSQNYSTC
jgi:hypothetical protein